MSVAKDFGTFGFCSKNLKFWLNVLTGSVGGNLLTVLHLGYDCIRVQWFANTKLVDSRDSELVLIALDEVGGIV